MAKLFRQKKAQEPVSVEDFDFGDIPASVKKVLASLEEHHASIVKLERSVRRGLYANVIVIAWVVGWMVYNLFRGGVWEYIFFGVNALSLGFSIYNLRRSVELFQQVISTHVQFHIHGEHLEDTLRDLTNDQTS